MLLFSTQTYLFHLYGPNGDELWTGCDCFRRGCSASFQNHKSCVILIPFVLYWLLSSCRVYWLAKDRRRTICSFRRACLSAVYSMRTENTCTDTPVPEDFTPLRSIIYSQEAGRKEGKLPPQDSCSSDQFFLPCVECARPREAGAPRRSQILDPLSPSNNTRRGERHRLQGLPLFYQNVLWLCLAVLVKTRPPVLVHQPEPVKRQMTN